MKAIETHYKGYRFRSRLEARWCVFFDAQGIVWEYEKEGYNLGGAGWYLPDFWLPQVKMWAEVKPDQFMPQELERCWALMDATGYEVILLEGMPDFRSYFCCAANGERIFVNTRTGETSHETDGGFPGGDFDLEIPWDDVIVSNGYLFDEHRFYRNTGAQDWPEPMRWQPSEYTGDHADADDYARAVYAARAARFEHGETPR